MEEKGKATGFQDQLLRRAANGDTDAFGTLIMHYEKLVYNIAYRMFGNPEDAKDMAQESFIKIYKNIDKCTDISYFRSWLCTVTTNTCIDELRKRRGKMTESMDKQLETEGGAIKRQLQSSVLTPEDCYMTKEMGQQLQTVISQLPPEQRVLVILRDMQGYSYGELADIMEAPLGTVKSRLARARQSLQEKITALREQNRL